MKIFCDVIVLMGRMARRMVQLLNQLGFVLSGWFSSYEFRDCRNAMRSYFEEEGFRHSLVASRKQLVQQFNFIRQRNPRWTPHFANNMCVESLSDRLRTEPLRLK